MAEILPPAAAPLVEIPAAQQATDTKPSETRKTDKTFENIAKDTNATLTVEKNDKGEVTDARAQLDKTVKNGFRDKEDYNFSRCGCKISPRGRNQRHHDYPDNKERFRQSDEQRICQCEGSAGRQKLTLVKVDKKTGEKVLISSRTYKVSKDGTVTADTKDAGDYVLLNEKDAKALMQ